MTFQSSIRIITNVWTELTFLAAILLWACRYNGQKWGYGNFVTRGRSRWFLKAYSERSTPNFSIGLACAGVQDKGDKKRRKKYVYFTYIGVEWTLAGRFHLNLPNVYLADVIERYSIVITYEVSVLWGANIFMLPIGKPGGLITLLVCYALPRAGSLRHRLYSDKSYKYRAKNSYRCKCKRKCKETSVALCYPSSRSVQM